MESSGLESAFRYFIVESRLMGLIRSCQWTPISSDSASMILLFLRLE